MRTKILIVSALLGVASIATTMGQTNVYSVNAVGYVNKSCSPGFSLVANPLNTTNNTLNSLLPYNNGAIPPGTQFFKYTTGSGYTVSTMDDVDFVWIPNLAVDPGQGGFFKNNTGGALTLTFVGEVLQGSLSNSLPQGYAIKSSMVPQQGTLGPNNIGLPNLAVPGVPGDQVFKYTTGSGYTVSTFDDVDFVWIPNLTIDVAESFFIKKGSADIWVRTFSVNN